MLAPAALAASNTPLPLEPPVGVTVRPSCQNGVMSTISVLERRIYAMRDVDHHLGLRSGTAKRWIDGYVRGGRSYSPVIRPRRSGEPYATWGEFIEAQLLAQFRADGATLQSLRPAVKRLREVWNTPYPLATRKAFLSVEGKELVEQLQDKFQVDEAVWIVRRVRDNQLELTAGALTFKQGVGFGRTGDAVSLRPDVQSPDVFMRPSHQFGRPSILGVPTEALYSAFMAGDVIESLAADFDLTRDQVEQAVRFESRRNALAA